jgi:transcriptional regulator with XRE-family HTH domain
MIRSEAEYRDAIARAQQTAERLVQYRDELRAKGLGPDEIERVVGSMVSLQDDLHEEIKRYQQFKEGDLSPIRGLREIGQLLIAARLARGLSQRELSEKLKIHESQVSRDERNEYQGISLERAAQILEVLSIDLEIEATLQRLAGDTGAKPLGESQQTSWNDGWAERQGQNATSPLS